MATLVRWDPFREMLDLRRQMDRVFDERFRSMSPWEEDGGSQATLALDVSEQEDSYTIKASIPGVNPDDIDITMNNDILTISGESKSEEESEQGQWHLRERRFGRFSRSIRLPTIINSDKIEATCDNGVLTLQLPKAEETKPRRISVQGGNGGSSDSRDGGNKRSQTIDGENQSTKAEGANI
ncbi:MAG: Hsp20/alpha crystallin family protein [Caldilineaceae bacterium]